MMPVTRAVKFITKWSAVSLLSVGMCELTVRVWELGPKYELRGRVVAGGHGILHFTLDKELLYRILPSPARQINAHGFRDREFRKEKQRPRIIVLGDSFPMGLAVPLEATFPKRLEETLSTVEVLNMAVQGYGPEQSLLAFERYGLGLKPDLVLLALYPSNDYHDLIKDELFSVGEDQRLVPNHPNMVESALPFLQVTTIVRFITTGHFLPPETEEALGKALFNDVGFSPLREKSEIERGRGLLRAVLKRFKDLADQASFRLAAVIIPSYHEIQGEGRSAPRFEYEEYALADARAQGVDVHDISQSFRSFAGEPLYLEADRHLSEAGHRATAQFLATLPEITELLRPGKK